MNNLFCHGTQPRGSLDRHGQAPRSMRWARLLAGGAELRFKNDPDVPKALEHIKARGCKLNP